MTQIKIEVPSNDPIALSALGEALQRIAAERTSGSEYFDGSEPTMAQTSADLSKTVKFEDIEPSGPTIKEMVEDGTLSPLPTDETKKGVTSYNDIARTVNASFDTPQNIMEEELKHVDDTTEQYEAGGGVEDDTLDADGLPWDKRIHSRGKTRLADYTWRLARKPNDKTQEEWDEYVTSVKAELKAVQNIPAPSDTVTPPVVDDTTQTEVDAGNLTPPVVETVTPPTLDEQAVADVQVSGPVAAVEPPASVTAPVVTDNTPKVSTFQELMKYITSDAAKRGATNDMIKEVLAQVDPSLTAIPLIANRADLIPTFVAKLEGRLS